MMNFLFFRLKTLDNDNPFNRISLLIPAESDGLQFWIEGCVIHHFDTERKGLRVWKNRTGQRLFPLSYTKKRKEKWCVCWWVTQWTIWIWRKENTKSFSFLVVCVYVCLPATLPSVKFSPITGGIMLYNERWKGQITAVFLLLLFFFVEIKAKEVRDCKLREKNGDEREKRGANGR